MQKAVPCEGWGKNKDEDVANEWYHKSAELGCDAAKGALTDLPF